jgi:hypothetical protein
MFKNSHVRALLFVLALLLSFATLANADTSALTSFSGGIDYTSGGDQLYGWIFTVNTPITVTALGVYDYTGNGLSISHDVGIFDQSSQSLLGSMTVPAGTAGTLINGFRYESVTPFALTQGDNYVIVMTMPAFNADHQSASDTSVTTASQITWVNSAFDVGSSLAFPNPGNNGSFTEGMFGPDFTFETTSVTPEPAYGVLGIGLTALLGFGFGIVRRRRA